MWWGFDGQDPSNLPSFPLTNQYCIYAQFYIYVANFIYIWDQKHIKIRDLTIVEFDETVESTVWFILRFEWWKLLLHFCLSPQFFFDKKCHHNFYNINHRWKHWESGITWTSLSIYTRTKWLTVFTLTYSLLSYMQKYATWSYKRASTYSKKKKNKYIERGEWSWSSSYWFPNHLIWFNTYVQCVMNMWCCRVCLTNLLYIFISLISIISCSSNLVLVSLLTL